MNFSKANRKEREREREGGPRDGKRGRGESSPGAGHGLRPLLARNAWIMQQLAGERTILCFRRPFVTGRQIARELSISSARVTGQFRVHLLVSPLLSNPFFQRKWSTLPRLSSMERLIITRDVIHVESSPRSCVSLVEGTMDAHVDNLFHEMD